MIMHDEINSLKDITYKNFNRKVFVPLTQLITLFLPFFKFNSQTYICFTFYLIFYSRFY